jgi:hypothetical protein
MRKSITKIELFSKYKIISILASTHPFKQQMSFHGVFYTNNTYYYSTAKKIVQNRKKHVRFKFPTPLNDLRVSSSGDTPAFLRNPDALFASQRESGFSSNSSADLVSYIAPVSPPFQFACQYPAIMCPPPPRISDE